MKCERCREALSALLDGEDAGVDVHALDHHLERCVACRTYELRIADLHRASRVRQAEPVPDLSAAILASVAPRANPHDPVLGWLRSGLTFVGVLLVILSAALLVSNSVENPAHLAAWDLAFGGALLVAAWQPDRARGLLPMAVLLLASMTAASIISISDGHDVSHGLVFHVTEFTGVVLLALLARHRAPGRSARGLPAI
jgi:predicted anti-sigma-YlaC factor YlaD